MGFTTASLINEQRGDILQITTGAKEFDDILDGMEAGLHSMPSHSEQFLSIPLLEMD